MNLARGRSGDGPAALLRSLLAAHLGLAGLARAEKPETQRRPFFVYLDEAHLFTTASLATMLAELRKYKVRMILANQHRPLLSPEMRDAVLGNAGTLIAFRLGADDARHLSPEFAPVFDAKDLLSLPNYSIYLKMLVGGEATRPFSAATLLVDSTF